MPDSKITALASIGTGADPANDPLVIVDVSDTTMAASGTTKKVTINQILGASGTATLASATITGALSAAGLNITGATVPTNGMYLPAANTLAWAINSAEAMRLNATGLGVGVTPSAGRGAIQLSAGVGFPATQVASSDANTLDDYEEGTWTGTLKGGTTDPTIPVTATGQYTKIGNKVFARIIFSNITTTGASGSISITGLPFANGANRTIGSCLLDLIGTFTGSPVCWVGGGGTTINFQSSNSNGAASDVTHNAGVNRFFYATITYTV